MVARQDYRTNNTPLAAYLIASGFELLHVEYEERVAFFVFANSNEQLEQRVSDYQTGKARVSVIAYETARRELLSRIKERRA